ncbi:M28 family peptidase [Rosenbergiella collisarenosi]|uniref:M28 family peptidase n=1 Tax=Rosenbergiella collisarenosi TaxID=1544695 RepID=UPI001F4E14C6|nr:M28 family peptidase [Rosenbergiella collisarenosi]
MLSLLKNKLASCVLCSSLLFSPLLAQAQSEQEVGNYADQQARYIATYFPGRMSGSPAEFLTAQYLDQQFTQLGYATQIHRQVGEARPRSALSVVAEHRGQLPQQILIVTHIDTPQALTAQQRQQNIGGLTFQGVDNSAASLGVMLELAKRLATTHKGYGLRFVALSGTQPPQHGVQDYLNSLSTHDRANTLLVIDIENIIAGKKLAFLNGTNTAAAVRKQTTGEAKRLAQHYHVSLSTAQLASSRSRTLTEFEKLGLPYMRVTASNTNTLITLAAADEAPLFHDDAAKDNLAFIDSHYPKRLQQRGHQLVLVLTPLLRGLLAPTSSAPKH